MPAKAGIQGKRRAVGPWIPAFAGMTNLHAPSFAVRLPDVFRPPLLRTPFAWLRAPLQHARIQPAHAGAGAEEGRLCPAGEAGGRLRADGEGLPLRLSDVRAMCVVLDRHVLLDELSEESAQRAVWRRARERALRGQAGDEMRLGPGLGRLPAYGQRPRHPRCAEAGR